jgi:uncharacterized damage-inducible protein DinB
MASAGLAQSAPPARTNPVSDNYRFLYGGIKAILLKSAELTPEEQYAFKPVDGVRTFGQIVGHVADSQYLFCSRAMGEKNPAPGVEKSKTTKADLIAALKESFAYCDRAYDALTDATLADGVQAHAGPSTKVGVLETNNLHAVEHYGNLVTYMRLRNLVPPTSDPQFMKAMMTKK